MSTAQIESKSRQCVLDWRIAAALVALILLAVFVPLIWIEAIPFSMFPMYSSRPVFLNIVTIRDKDGKEIPASDFGLHLELHPWAPRYAGMPAPHTYNPTDRALSKKEVIGRIRAEKSHLSVDEVAVKIDIIGPRLDGSYGPLETLSFEVSE